MKVAIYSRKSKYTGKGDSVENQIRMCREYISFHTEKFKDVSENDISIFEDEGYSGKSLDRPQFQEMMKRARQKQFDYIICYRLDRISRSVSDFSSLVEAFNDLGVSFICIREDFDTRTSMGRAMMNIASTFAQLERETIAERVKDNMMMLARTGRWLGGTPPTGFTSEKVTEVIMDGKSKTSCKLKWNPDEMDVVKTIFTKFMELQSISGVCKYLIKNNVRSRNDRYYSLPGIREILTNPVYCIADREAREYFLTKNSNVCFEENDCSNKYGMISYNKRDYTRKSSPRMNESEWIIAIGRHPGVINGRDWVAIQMKLAENRQFNRGHTKITNEYSLLSGLIICRKCNARMFAKQRSNNRLLFDYICSNKLKGGSALCNCRNLNGPETDGRICDFLMSYMTEGSDAWKLFEKLKKEVQSSTVGADAADDLEAKIADRKRRIENYVHLMGEDEQPNSSIKYIQTEISNLDQELYELKKQKEAMISRLENQTDKQIKIDAAIRLLSAFQNNFRSLTIPEQRELIRILVDRIEWDGANIHIFLYGR